MDSFQDERRKHRGRLGKLGEYLVLRSQHIKRLVPKGCRVVDGHKPDGCFSNLQDVYHLDLIIYDPTSNQILAICEVKTRKDPKERRFEANGDCAKVMLQAKAAGIPIFLAVVRWSKTPPMWRTKDEFKAYATFLLQNPEEYRIEFYDSGQFEIMDDHFVTGNRNP